MLNADRHDKMVHITTQREHYGDSFIADEMGYKNVQSMWNFIHRYNTSFPDGIDTTPRIAIPTDTNTGTPGYIPDNTGTLPPGHIIPIAPHPNPIDDMNKPYQQFPVMTPCLQLHVLDSLSYDDFIMRLKANRKIPFAQQILDRTEEGIKRDRSMVQAVINLIKTLY